MRAPAALPALALLAVLALTAGAARRDPTETVLVEIPVHVSRDRLPVRGLTAADFEVTEQGRPLPVVAIDPIRGAKEGARRNVFLLFDVALTRPERLAEGIAAARKLVDQGLDRGDLVAVGVYPPQGEVLVLLNFTSDRAAADRTLAALQAALPGKTAVASPPAEPPDPLRLTGRGVRSLLSGLVIQPVEARRDDQVMALAQSVASLADALRQVAGRRTMVLFSEGFPVALLAAHPEGPGGQGALMARLAGPADTLRRSGWELRPVSLRGVRFGPNADGLFYFASQAGGSIEEGSADLARGLDAEWSAAYNLLLTVRTAAAAEGSYHPLNVRLRNPLPRTLMHARAGYSVPIPFRQQKEVQRLAEAARLVMGNEERNELGVKVSATPVAVTVEVSGSQLLASGIHPIALEVFGYALTETGRISDDFAQDVSLDPVQIGPRFVQEGVRIQGKLDLPPGRHRLRVLVRDRRDGRLAVLTILSGGSGSGQRP